MYILVIFKGVELKADWLQLLPLACPAHITYVHNSNPDKDQVMELYIYIYKTDHTFA